jgi:hypothetical protein
MLEKSFWEKLLDKAPLFVVVLGTLFVLVSAGSGWTKIEIQLDPLGRILLAVVGIGLIIYGSILLWREQKVKDQPIPQNQPTGQSKTGPALTLFSTNTQTTKLIPRDDGLELSFVDKNEPARSQRRLLPAANLKNILAGEKVSVSPKSGVNSNYGLLSLGPWKNWLYSKDLFATTDSLENEVHTIIHNVIEGK